MNQPIKNLSLTDIELFLSEAGLPKFRFNQLVEWLYGKSATSYDAMTNIPKTMREQLSESLPLHNPIIRSKQVSIDGSRKFLIEYHDGALAETVGMPSDDGRLTACVSSQSGCAMGCIFCATGKNGFNRNLFPGEIADQVTVVQNAFETKVTNVVVMGQGEPFANYDNVMAALKIINHPKLFNIGARHITVSTCGIINCIEQFSHEPEQYTLAISLHSARQEVRDQLIPAMKSQRIGSLRKALVQYTEATGRRVSLEYALMIGINDSDSDLEELMRFCHRLLCHVNLIPLNKVEGSPIKPVSREKMRYWNERLQEGGISSTIRKSRGSDISAACGQLASQFIASN